jgi:peptidylprolyl isomerase
MEEIKNHDFVEIDYVAKIKGLDQIFDLTNEKDAKAHNFYDEHRKYGPMIICVGENNLVSGLDKNLLGKKPGKYKFEIDSNEGFGKKNPKLIKLVNKNVFIKQNINPVPGLQIDIDNAIGTIRSVSGGRCIVDFNHPLAGRDLEYDLHIIRIITDNKDKIKSLLNFVLGLDDEYFELAENEKSIKVSLKTSKKIPKEMLEEFKKHAKTIINDLANLEFVYSNTTTPE